MTYRRDSLTRTQKRFAMLEAMPAHLVNEPCVFCAMTPWGVPCPRCGNVQEITQNTSDENKS